MWELMELAVSTKSGEAIFSKGLRNRIARLHCQHTGKSDESTPQFLPYPPPMIQSKLLNLKLADGLDVDPAFQSVVGNCRIARQNEAAGAADAAAWVMPAVRICSSDN
jgi:hypothetical protein